MKGDDCKYFGVTDVRRAVGHPEHADRDVHTMTEPSSALGNEARRMVVTAN